MSGPSYACSWLVMVWGAGGGGGAGGKRHNNGASGEETRIIGPDLDLRALGGAGGHAPEETDGWNGQHAASGSAVGGSGRLIVAGGGAGGGQEGGDRVRRGDDLVGQPGRPGGLVIAQVRPTAGAAYRITIGAGGAAGIDPRNNNDRGGAGGAGRVAILEMR